MRIHVHLRINLIFDVLIIIINMSSTLRYCQFIKSNTKVLLKRRSYLAMLCYNLKNLRSAILHALGLSETARSYMNTDVNTLQSTSISNILQPFRAFR